MPEGTTGGTTIEIPQPLKIKQDDSGLLAEIAMRLYMNMNFNNEKYSDNEAGRYADYAVKRAKRLIQAINK